MKDTKWFMVEDALSINFDRVVYPKITKDPLVNQAAQSDRLMGRHFRSWIQERQNRTEEEERQPFFAQFYFFDAHWPFYNDADAIKNKTTDRIEGMLMTVDKGLEDIFAYLADAGELENTVIIGSGDHGETYVKKEGENLFKRVQEWVEDVLHPLTYMYIPKRLSAQKPEIVQNLKHNRHQLVSTLDLYPTTLHFMNGILSKDSHNARTDLHCVRGHDLLEKKIDSDRVAWSFGGDFSKAKSNNVGLHHGTGSSLIYHFGFGKDKGLEIYKYKDIVGSPARNSTKKRHLTIEDWKRVVQDMEGTENQPIIDKKDTSFTRLKDLLERS